jgi:hypothetical protein
MSLISLAEGAKFLIVFERRHILLYIRTPSKNQKKTISLGFARLLQTDVLIKYLERGYAASFQILSNLLFTLVQIFEDISPVTNKFTKLIKGKISQG